MAAHDASHAKANPETDAVSANRFFRVCGAVGRITAAALHAQHYLEGRKDHAIRADQKDGNRLHEPSSMTNFPKKATPTV